jgi:hypothetical protein
MPNNVLASPDRKLLVLLSDYHTMSLYDKPPCYLYSSSTYIPF